MRRCEKRREARRDASRRSDADANTEDEASAVAGKSARAKPSKETPILGARVLGAFRADPEAAVRALEALLAPLGYAVVKGPAAKSLARNFSASAAGTPGGATAGTRGDTEPGA